VSALSTGRCECKRYYLLSNLRAQSDLQSRAFALDVALVRSLGGGYSPDAT